MSHFMQHFGTQSLTARQRSGAVQTSNFRSGERSYVFTSEDELERLRVLEINRQRGVLYLVEERNRGLHHPMHYGERL